MPNNLDEKYTYEYFCQENVCRLCWKISDDAKSFKKEATLVKLVEKHIGVTVSGHILQALCSVCEEEIRCFSTFKQFCLQLDKKINRIIAVHPTMKKDSPQDCKDPSNKSKECYNSKKNENLSHLATPELKLLKDNVQKETNGKKNLILKPDRDTLNYNKDLFLYEDDDDYLLIDDNYCYFCSLDFNSCDLKNKHDVEVHKIKQEIIYKCFSCKKVFSKLSQKIKHEPQCKIWKQRKANFNEPEVHNFISENLGNNHHKIKINNVLSQNHRLEKKILQNITDNDKLETDKKLWEDEEVELEYARIEKMIQLAQTKVRKKDITVKASRTKKVKKYKCRSCDETYESKDELKTHMSNHPKAVDMPGICEICGKVFRCAGNLVSHMKIHNNYKQFKCPYCDLRTNLKHSIKTHIRRVHLGERQYSCPLCPKLFFTPSIQALHLRTVHNKIRDFKCHICSNCYESKHKMKKHIKSVHNGIRPVKCTHCSSRVEQHLLDKHIRIKHGNCENT